MLVRRKALSSLVKLGVSMPNIFVPHLEKIGPAILGLANDGKLLKSESRILVEFLIVVM